MGPGSLDELGSREPHRDAFTIAGSGYATFGSSTLAAIRAGLTPSTSGSTLA